MRDHALADHGLDAFAQLEHERVAEMVLLDRRLADVELSRLTVMIGECLRSLPHLRSLDRLEVGAIAP